MNSSRSPRVAAVVPAKDEADRIADTIDALSALPMIDMVVVVDDGSDDETYEIARECGTTAFRHPVNRGKAAAMQTGAAVVEMLDDWKRDARLMLFADADLGSTAGQLGALIGPVAAGDADVTIATLPPQEGAGGHGLVTGLARSAIVSMTGWNPQQPLSGQRCLTRAAYQAATPLAYGWGVETGMTIDVLRAGHTVQEVACELRHRATANDLAGQIHRAKQYRDVLLAVGHRRVVGSSSRPPAPQEPGLPYSMASMFALLAG